MLPRDPFILLSFVNTKLRDECPSLEELCAALGADQAELTASLERAGFTYDAALNQFR